MEYVTEIAVRVTSCRLRHKNPLGIFYQITGIFRKVADFFSGFLNCFLLEWCILKIINLCCFD